MYILNNFSNDKSITQNNKDNMIREVAKINNKHDEKQMLDIINSVNLNQQNNTIE
jgi:hypothetical protein